MHIFENVTSLMTSLRGVIAMKIGCLRYKGKTKTNDVRRIKIFCLPYVEKSKIFMYNSVNRKNECNLYPHITFVDTTHWSFRL